MRGLTVGEVSSASNPVLQLFARSGGNLVDIYSGTYRIEDVRVAGATPVVKVSATSIVEANKLATGRYLLATGTTTTWSVGSHRAVVHYTLEDGGPTYMQVIDFEVLDAVDWPSGGAYTGYLSTRQAYQDSYAADTVLRPQLHRLIADVSRSIEQWTHRWFDPRYLNFLVNGHKAQDLLFDSPIIAIGEVSIVWNTGGVENSYLYDPLYYRVYNRHLSGYFETDDRRNPKIGLKDIDSVLSRTTGYLWPDGRQNLRVKGVFGYTDPDFDPNGGDVLIGRTPADIGRACGALIARILADPTLTDPMTWAPGSVRSYRTRYQSVTFGGGGGGSSGGGGASDLSGDPLVDAILIKYCKPPAFGAV